MDKFTREFNNKVSQFHRFLYIGTAGILLLSYVGKMSTSLAAICYYLFFLLVFGICDELMAARYMIGKKVQFEYKSLAQMASMTLGMLLFPGDQILFAFNLIIFIIIAFEYIVYGLLYDDYPVNMRRIIASIMLSCYVILYFRKYVEVQWVFIFIVIVFVIGIFLFALTEEFIDNVHKYEDITTSMRFRTLSIEEDNKKLKTYQERLNNVNNEINYQRIKIEKANEDLASMNDEIRSQIETMKFFSSSFDVHMSMDKLIATVSEVTGADVAAIYIKENTFNNKRAESAIKCKNQKLHEITKRCLSDAFKMMSEGNHKQPLALSVNGKSGFDFYEGEEITDTVIFPAYNSEDEIYGVMIVASSQHDFFYRGYAYYESFLVEFGVALKTTQLYTEMQEMARRDGLTGIYNRVYFSEKFKKMCADAKENNTPLSVALFDIDKFKSVNDTYGHLAGDEVIKMVASTGNEFSEKYNGMAVRFGGEEFLLILPGKNISEAEAVLKKLHTKIKSTTVNHEDVSIDVNVCIGITSFPEICSDVNQLVNRADAAMYYGKKNGRGMLVIDDGKM